MAEAAANRELDAQQRPPIASRLGVPTLYVLLGNIFTLAVGLPFQIYVSRMLGPSGIGAYGLLDAAVATTAGLAGLGIGRTTVRFVSAHLERGEFSEAVGLLWTGALLLLPVGGLTYLALLLSLPWIAQLWPEIGAYHRELVTMGALIPLSLLAYFFQQGLRGFQEIRPITVGSSVLQLTVRVMLTLAAFAAGLRLEGYILATVFATLCCVFWLFFALVRKIRELPNAKPTIGSLRQWRRFAMISYSGDLLGTATHGLDRFLLGAFVGSGAVGILVVARQLQALPERFNQMLLVVGAPMFSAAYGGNQPVERQHLYNMMTDWVVRASLPLVLFLWLFGHEVLALYGAEFAAAGTVPLCLLVGAQLLSIACGPTGNIAMMSGLERPFLRLTFAATLLLAALLAILVHPFGLLGVVVALLAEIVFLNAATLLLVQRELALRWWNERFLAWLPQGGAALAVGILALSTSVRFGAVELVGCLIAMYTAAVGATFLHGWHEDDRLLLRQIRQRWLTRVRPG